MQHDNRLIDSLNISLALNTSKARPDGLCYIKVKRRIKTHPFPTQGIVGPIVGREGRGREEAKGDGSRPNVFPFPQKLVGQAEGEHWGLKDPGSVPYLRLWEEASVQGSPAIYMKKRG